MSRRDQLVCAGCLVVMMPISSLWTLCRCVFPELRRVPEILGYGLALRATAMAHRYRHQAGANGAPSIGCKPFRFIANIKPEAFVALGRDLIAFLLVGGHPADIWHEDTRLPGDIGADIPRVREGIEGTVRDLVVVLHPSSFGLFLCFDAAEPSVAHVLQAIGDPVHVLLASQDHLAFDAGALRAGDHEEVRKPGNHDAEIGSRTVFPFLSNRD